MNDPFNIKNIILILVINLILLNINEILCESYITLKIHKSGKYNILFKGDIDDNENLCYGVSMRIPNSMKINGI